jgi:hypothetical protein
MKTPRDILITIASFLSLAAQGHALPDVKFDKSKSLGTWEQFVTSLGLQDSPAYGPSVFLDTDRLVAGAVRNGWSGREGREVLRENVGRLVQQKGGPDIVVYDFEEIYTIDAQNESLPSKIILFGRRPAAIVADGQISNWPSERGSRLSIEAHNSCNPDNLAEKATSTARGGDGYVQDSEWGTVLVGAGSGGYGSAGDSGMPGVNSDRAGLLPGSGGPASFSWGILRPGSAGGDVIEQWPGGERHLGAAAGGAVWLKSGGRLDVHEISALGKMGDDINLRWTGGGSGGHVIVESPEIPRLTYVYVYGNGAWSSQEGGVGVVEFRGTPGMPDFPDYGYIWGGSSGVDVPVGLPAGISFSGREPKLTQSVREVRRPRIPPPAVSARTLQVTSRQRSFTVDAAASAPAGSFPARIRYRLRPPGAEVFGPWFVDELPPGSARRKSWRKDLSAPTEGKWQVEVVVEDNKGSRSTGKVAEVALDHTKPTVWLDAKSIKRTDQPGRFNLETFVSDWSSNRHAVNSGPARVEYRLKRPGATRFGKWRRFALGDKDQYPNWPSATVLVPATLKPLQSGTWTVEMRAVDLAKNISEIATLEIRQ